jgi:hypothetical protein
MKNKLVLTLLIAVILIAIGFFGFRYLKINSTMGAVTPIIQNISLRTTNDVRYEYEPAQISYKEYFEKYEKDLSEIESKIIDVQSISATYCENRVSAAIAYARSCQELLRSLLNKSRKSLAASSAMEWNKQALQRYLASSSYGTEYAKESFDESKKDVETKLQEYKDAAKELSPVIKKFEDARKLASTYLPGKYIVDTIVIDKLKKKNDEELKGFEK